jgi:hypothetical protein
MRISNRYIDLVMGLSLILIVVCLFIIICIGIGFWEVSYYANTTEVLSYASVIMATANALLLYATLSYQGRSFRQERFEMTLFNLLDNHRRIKEYIQIDISDVDSCESETISNNNIFLYACQELRIINDILRESEYPKSILLQYGNRYNLTEVKWNDLSKRIRSGKKKADIIFFVFYEKWRDFYAPFIRSLSVIVSHIANNNDIDLAERERYKDYLIAQMSQHEYTIMIFYYFYDSDFHKQLDAISNNCFFSETEEELFRRLIFKR